MKKDQIKSIKAMSTKELTTMLIDFDIKIEKGIKDDTAKLAGLVIDHLRSIETELTRKLKAVKTLKQPYIDVVKLLMKGATCKDIAITLVKKGLFVFDGDLKKGEKQTDKNLKKATGFISKVSCVYGAFSTGKKSPKVLKAVKAIQTGKKCPVDCKGFKTNVVNTLNAYAIITTGTATVKIDFVKPAPVKPVVKKPAVKPVTA